MGDGRWTVGRLDGLAVDGVQWKVASWAIRLAGHRVDWREALVLGQSGPCRPSLSPYLSIDSYSYSYSYSCSFSAPDLTSIREISAIRGEKAAEPKRVEPRRTRMARMGTG